MRLKKVILCGHTDALGDAVETFLLRRKDWKVIRMLDESTAQTFMEQMEKEQPDVIIVYEAEQAHVTSFPYQLLQLHPEIKVITLSLENNYLEVYDKHRVQVKQVSDLFAAIDA